MENNENEEFVDKTTENAEEQTAEKIVEGIDSTVEDGEGEEFSKEAEKSKETSEKKTEYTDAEIEALLNSRVDEILPSKIRRERSKIEREYKEKYSPLMETLKAGMGEDKAGDPEAAMKTFAEMFKEKGIDIQDKQPTYSEKHLKILANAESEEIIAAGYEEINEEIERLSMRGADKMSAMEKLVFKNLMNAKKIEDNKKDLLKIGVKEEILNDKKFTDFALKFSESISIKEIYELYKKTQEPKKKAEPLGSLKNPNPKEPKTFISEAEYDKMTSEEIKANSEVIRESMLKW